MQKRLQRARSEKGFTLIELLVVMIIIGILAAIAIPIYLNQQKSARDTQTVSDLKSAATSISGALPQFPDADYIRLRSGTQSAGDGTPVEIVVGNRDADGELDDHIIVTVPVSDGTILRLNEISAGSFHVAAFNPGGKKYFDRDSRLSYWNARGGIVSL